MPTTYDAIANLASTMGSALANTNSTVSTISSGLSTTNVNVFDLATGLDDTNSVVSSISSGLAALATDPLMIAPFTLATLPSASVNNHKLIRVTDATGGEKICQSDGTDWKLINTTTTVS